MDERTGGVLTHHRVEQQLESLPLHPDDGLNTACWVTQTDVPPLDLVFVRPEGLPLASSPQDLTMPCFPAAKLGITPGIGACTP